MRRRDEKPRSARYGENRYGRGPYDRKAEQSWREKKVEEARVTGKSPDNADVHGGSSKAHEVVPYGQSSDMIKSSYGGKKHGETEEHISGGSRGNRRLASAIVTPSHQQPTQDDNVTIQGKNVALALTFSPQWPSEVENDQVIGALEGMELLDSNDVGMMNCDAQDDDLLAEEVKDMEEKARHSSVAGSSMALSHNDRKASKGGARWTAPLGIQSKRERFFVKDLHGSVRPRALAVIR